MRLEFPAAARNRDPILAVLRNVFQPPIVRVLEIGSGSGEHAVHFAREMPSLVWQPSDVEPAHLASIDAWREQVTNVLPALRLDPRTDPLPACDAIFCANVIHIAPWGVALAIVAGARALPVGAPLVFYGPFRRDGKHTAPSNEAFDASLRSRDPEWGVRDVAELAAAAEGFVLESVHEMPANNLTVVLRRA
jgi:SAM-dependent methyltransferase